MHHFRTRGLQPFQSFIQSEAAAGVLLLAATVIALLWANSPWAGSYDQFWLTAAAPNSHISLQFVVNDALMAVFFLVVGLEIKREVLVGELAHPQRAALPVIAALGGAVLPALIYLAWNHSGPARGGWGVPMATDIAFAVGVMALLSDRVPLGAKVFLTALAIADDLLAVLVIALFYTSHISVPDLAAAAVCLAMLAGCNLAGARRPWLYLLFGLMLWFFTLRSGVHATVAGVLLAVCIPARGQRALLHSFEESLHPWVAYGIMPVFALANAGLSLRGPLLPELHHPVVLGVWMGLLAGKPAGISLAIWVAIRARWAVLPLQTSWRSIHAVTWLGGIGFTMSLFIAHLAFHDHDTLQLAKLGILGGSLSAGGIGGILLLGCRKSGER